MTGSAGDIRVIAEGGAAWRRAWDRMPLQWRILTSMTPASRAKQRATDAKELALVIGLRRQHQASRTVREVLHVVLLLFVLWGGGSLLSDGPAPIWERALAGTVAVAAGLAWSVLVAPRKDDPDEAADLRVLEGVLERTPPAPPAN